jgi:hypothetical protein
MKIMVNKAPNANFSAPCPPYLIEATYSRHATPMLLQANLGLEKLRFMFRLAVDLQLLDLRRHEFAARAVDEVGRLVGGWIKAKGSPDAQTAH